MELEMHDGKFVLRCCQSCYGPREIQSKMAAEDSSQYFVTKSPGWTLKYD